MKRVTTRFLAGVLIVTAAIVHADSDVTTDGSVGPALTVPEDPTKPGRYRVTESIGRRSGRNLFQSFDRFGVGAGDKVVFEATSPTDHVISRVTGGAESQIDGLLKSKIPGADFWFLNPAGVVFGEGASLKVDGVFNASTADSVDFQNGEVFPADLNAPLTFSTAPAVDFGFLSDSSARFRVDGATLENTDGFFVKAGRVQLRNAAELRVSDEEGGSLGGIRIEAGEDVSLGGGSVLTTFRIGNSGDGAISILADDVSLDGGSRIASRTDADAAAGSVSIEVQGDLALDRASSIQSLSHGSGDTGGLSLIARMLSVEDGSQLATRSSGSGRPGDIDLDVRELALGGSSRIEVEGDASSDAVGAIRIGLEEGQYVTRDVEVRSGSSLRTRSTVSGGGDISVATGENLQLLRGEVSTDVGGVGGNIQLTADRIIVQRGVVSASSQDAGSGDLVIRADRIQVSQDSELNASGMLEVDGDVVTNPLDATLESRMTPLPTDYLDAPALLIPRCSARDTRGPGSRFVVPRRSGTGRAPEDLLVQERRSEDPLAGEPFSPSANADDAPLMLAETRGAAAHEEVPVRDAAEFEALGREYSVRGRLPEAAQALERALAMSRQAGDRAGEASAWEALGHQRVAAGDLDAAQQAFARSAELALELGDVRAEVEARANQARAAAEAGAVDAAETALDQARVGAESLADDRARRFLWVHLGRSARLIADVPSETQRDRELDLEVEVERASLAAHALLTRAIDESRRAGDDATLSHALGELGALYESAHRDREALALSRRALAAAERAEAPESIYRWHWQLGRIHWRAGRGEAAARALRRAVDLLEDTRQETLSNYRGSEVFFRGTVAPVYLDLVDALLQSSERVDAAAERDVLLREARSVVEALKAAELRDYYRDDCVADLRAQEVDLDDVSNAAAVIYPIVLPDRLEVLVFVGGKIERHQTAVRAEVVAETVRSLRWGLRGVTHAYRIPAERLYGWLMRPFEDVFAEQGVETLVFVPDGPLRMVPIAALYDGEKFLVERYATAVTPGLEVVDPGPLDRDAVRPLAAGLSVARSGFNALPHVPAELDVVRETFGGTVLLDADFSLEAVDLEIRGRRPTLIHIASHGEFTGDAGSSFLLTWDGPLTMDRLADLVGSGRFSDEPLELLVLSACKTASGDERAALGLAGLAVRSGARSAVGSLWRIGDAATGALMANFYRSLADPSLSRGEALRRAQLALLRSPDFAHPRYWSAFLMIGNWL